MTAHGGVAGRSHVEGFSKGTMTITDRDRAVGRGDQGADGELK